MAKIVGATEHKCYGVGIIGLETPNEEKVSKKINGMEVKEDPSDIAVQHVEDGQTRVICEHLSNGHHPDTANHCLKLIGASKMACANILAGRPVVSGDVKFTTETVPCRWIVPPLDEPEK